MNERAPGELDPFADGKMSDRDIIIRIQDNIRARRNADNNFDGYATEEEADWLILQVKSRTPHSDVTAMIDAVRTNITERL